MMSDFMFPIYLATNKIQRQRKNIQKRRKDSTDTEEGTTEERPAVGQDKQERGKAKAW